LSGGLSIPQPTFTTRSLLEDPTEFSRVAVPNTSAGEDSGFAAIATVPGRAGSGPWRHGDIDLSDEIYGRIADMNAAGV
jgi:hypothetical protein